MTVPNISIIIVNHNACEFLRQTLKSVEDQEGITTEIIVVDNASTDDSRSMVESEFKTVKWISRDSSVGFSAANNLGLKMSIANIILFLNPDVTFTTDLDLKQCYDKLMSDETIGALTPRVNLVSSGDIDQTCHRGFPTPFSGFTHFSGLAKLFPRSSLFNQYTKRYLGYSSEHEIDAVGGMFMLMRRSVGEQVGWWDEDYPFYGEDLDLCYRLKQAGYHNWYFPLVTVRHFKGATTGMTSHSLVDLATTRQVKLWSVRAMELFYAKHYVQIYPFFISWLVYLGIKILKFRRLSL